MTRRLVLSFAFAIGGSLLAEDPAADAVRAAADGWRDALIRQDKASLDRLIAEDLVYTHAGGKTQNKAEYIESVTTGPSRYESFTDSDTKIRVYGDVAILTGNVDVKLVGRDIYRVRTLEIYKKNNGQWQFAVKEGVRVPKPER